MSEFRCVTNDPSERYRVNGTQLTFDNGLTVSMMWGYDNYISDRMNQSPNSPNCEMAAWWSDEFGKRAGWLKLSAHDDVIGYVTPDQAIQITEYLRTIDQKTPRLFYRNAIVGIIGK